MWTGRGGAYEWRTADPSASPDFLLSCGFDQVCVVLFEENHMLGRGEDAEAGNLGTLGMANRRG